MLNNEFIFNNALNAIICNDDLSKQIEKIIKNIDGQMEALQDFLDYLRSQVQMEEDMNGNLVSQVMNGQNMRRVRKPFFSTNSGLIPFTNETVKQKMKDGVIDVYDYKSQLRKICNNADFATLKNAISRNIRDIEYNRLKRSRCKNSEKEMYMLKNVSETDLLKRCDAEMINKIDWLMIANYELKGRLSPENCRHMTDKLINPQFVHTKWTESENIELLKLTEELGFQGKWVQISEKLVIKRQPFACFKQWLELTRKFESSEEWTSEEDELLCDLVKKYNQRKDCFKNINWNEISLLVPNRSSRDCERRWESIQVQIKSRPFSHDDDLKMLFLIKRYDSENWSDIAREMDQRTIEECQDRFCAIVDDLCEWTYIEDRRLWLILKPYFRELWEMDHKALNPTRDLTIYKSVMKGFSGRCPIVIRYRYAQLCKWFQLWHKFCLKDNTQTYKSSTKRLPLLSETDEDKEIVMKRISKILMQTPFFNLIRETFISIGSKNPEKEAYDLISMTNSGYKGLIEDLMKKSQNIKLMKFIFAIKDISNGNFIPLKFDDYQSHEFRGLKNPKKANESLSVQGVQVRIYESKVAIAEALRKKMNGILSKDGISDTSRKCLEKLLDCAGLFITALNFSISYLEKTHKVKLTDKANKLFKYLSDILCRMMDYAYAQDRQVLSKQNIRLQFHGILSTKLEEIGQLLLYRDFIPSIYKTFFDGEKKDEVLITKYLSKSLLIKLSKRASIKISSMNILQNLAMTLQFPTADLNSSQGFTNDIQLLTPDKLKLHFLRSLLLQKSNLLSSGKDQYIKMIRAKYNKSSESLSDEDKNSSTILSDPRYSLLRSRLFSLIAIPTIMARISPFACVIAADKIYEEQNERIPSRVSQSFNVVKPLIKNNGRDCVRKREFLEHIHDENPLPQVTKISKSGPLSRRCSKSWVRLCLPEKKKVFFLSKHVIKYFVNNNIEIHSINGVPVTQFMN